MLNAVILSVIILNTHILSVIMLSVVMMNVIMLNVVMLNVANNPFMLSVGMPSVSAIISRPEIAAGLDSNPCPCDT
jgi:hypothetical protein